MQCGRIPNLCVPKIAANLAERLNGLQWENEDPGSPEGQLQDCRSGALAEAVAATPSVSGPAPVQDFAEALKWYRLAAAQGDTNAQFNLGVMHGKRQGVAQGSVRAQMWFDPGSEFGDADKVEMRNFTAT